MNYEIEYPWIHIHIDSLYENKSVEQFLDDYKISRKHRYLLQQQKHILWNGKDAPLNQNMRKHGILTIYGFSFDDNKIRSVDAPITIAYEDEFLLIVHKAPHLLIHSDGNNEITLSNYVQGYYDTTGQTCAVRPLHRLDKDTSGLVMFSKCSFFQPYFDDCLQQKKIHREYMAIVEGKLPLHKPIVIQQPIGKDRHHAQKQRVSKTGKNAYTRVECLQQYKNTSLVSCTLKTGRTHQIRVHLAHINHPIISDPLYGHSHKAIARLALHAYRLTWVHPITQKEIVISCDLPEDMKKVIKKAC